MTNSLDALNFEIDPRMESYAPLICPDWTSQILRFAKQHPALDQFVFPFIANWRAICNTVAMPFTLVSVMAEGTETSVNEMWEKCLAENQFRLTLWSSQRMGYLSYFNAYEDLIVSAIKFAGQYERCRVTDNDFNKKMRESLSSEICDKCWTDSRIGFIREIRNSLSHAGGKIIKKLEGKTGDIEIKDGILQIMPRDTIDAVNQLTRSAHFFVGECSKLEHFPRA